MDKINHIVLVMALMVASVEAHPSGYIGCFDDNKERILRPFIAQLDPNGADYCSTKCKAMGFRYAGTEYSSYCLCGNQIQPNERSNSQCTFPCTSNVEEICGGSWKISIYDTWQNSTGFLGCYNDRIYHRTLHETNKNMETNGARYCIEFCWQKGYRYAGTEYKYECHCGNTIRGTKTSITECNDPCTNNEKESCGGSLRISIYDTWQATTTTTLSTTPTTTTRPSQTPVTNELPTTKNRVDITKTIFNTNTDSSTSLYEKQTDTDDQSGATTYISIASGVVAMVVVVIVMLLIYRRRKTKARNHDNTILHKIQTIKQTVNDEPNNISSIDVDRSSRSTTLCGNEHVLMTAVGELVNVEYHATKSATDCDDYNTLCLSGKGAVTGFCSNARPNQRANQAEDTYSHLNEHNIDQTSSDTYSQVTRNRLNDTSLLCDSTYSHIGQAATQSLALENVIAPDGIYNTLNTLPKRKGIKKNPSNYKDINSGNGDQVYGNNSSADAVKGVRINEGNYSHVLDSKLAQATNNTSRDADNIYAKVVKKPNSAHNSGNTEAGQSKPQYYIPENVEENIHGKDCFNDDQTYYNV